MTDTAKYPYIRSLSLENGNAVITGYDGTVNSMSTMDFLHLYNAVLEDLWFYEEMYHEALQDANEWLYAYETVADQLYG